MWRLHSMCLYYRVLFLLRLVRHSSLYGVGPRGSCAGRQYCLRGGEAIRAWGHAGPAQFPRVPRRSRGPRGLAGPFHQKAMWPNCVVRVHARPAQVLCGFKSSCLRGGEAIKSALRGFRGSHAGPTPPSSSNSPDFHVMLSGFQTPFIRKRCGLIARRGSTRVHARPRRSEREGLDSRGKFFVGSTPQAIMRRGATRVLRGRVPQVPRGSLAGPSRVPRRSILHCTASTHRWGF